MYVTDCNTHGDKIRSFALSTSTDELAGTWATVAVHRGEDYCKLRSNVSNASVARVMRAQKRMLEQGGAK